MKDDNYMVFSFNSNKVMAHSYYNEYNKLNHDADRPQQLQALLAIVDSKKISPSSTYNSESLIQHALNDSNFDLALALLQRAPLEDDVYDAFKKAIWDFSVHPFSAREELNEWCQEQKTNLISFIIQKYDSFESHEKLKKMLNKARVNGKIPNNEYERFDKLLAINRTTKMDDVKNNWKNTFFEEVSRSDPPEKDLDKTNKPG